MSNTSSTEAWVEKILESTRGVFEVFGMYLGVRLGYYECLSKIGPADSTQLAKRTGTNERYALNAALALVSIISAGRPPGRTNSPVGFFRKAFHICS
jgi:hypothetical protein